MIPAPSSSQEPYFSSCLNWILENQHTDGSWGLPIEKRDSSMMKDSLSSTLASVLALKKWGVGDRHVSNALRFMERNSGSLTDPAQETSIGFDVIFPAMIQTCAQDFNLNLPLNQSNVDVLVRNRDSALNSATLLQSEGSNAYLAYISEGIGNSLDRHWETAKKFQRKNGSLFNSPSATAAAFIHLRDADSLRYLRSVVDVTYRNSAAVYPNGIYYRLCLIDEIESLGIDRLFRDEIKLALDEIYNFWQLGDEEIFLDSTTCAMAFRILRLNRYPVSPGTNFEFNLVDVFNRFTEDRFWNDTMEGYLKDERAVLELHKASQVIYPDESILEHQQSWTSQFLAKQHESSSQKHVNNRSKASKYISTQVNNVLENPFKEDLERLTHRRNIEQYCTDNTRTMKSSFSCSSFGNEDFLRLATEDFNFCQSLHQKELGQLMSWLKVYKLDDMRLAKVKMGYCYFSAAATYFDPELSHARISWAKHSLLTSLIDDFYDIFGTAEEHVNLLEHFERWDVNGPRGEFCSEEVKTFYWALHIAICETVENAYACQGRSIMDHVVELWVDVLRTMLEEAEWSRTNTLPSLDEYMRNGYISFALGPIVLPSLYMVGPQLSEEVAKGPEVHRLFKLMSTCGRLLNDCRSFQREAEEGISNAVSLRMSQGIETAEEAIEEIKELIDEQTKELLMLVLDERDVSRVPKECRELFWKMNKVLHLVYKKEDTYNSMKLVQVAESVIKEPISLSFVNSNVIN
ncbi:Ent-kaur-16-ene synthase, chloroplastic [Linum perenne]